MKKILASCPVCHKKNNIPNFNFIKAEQNDDCVYTLECHQGHKFILIQQIQRFELKFDLACISYINDDYSASVMHCASAIERFHQFFVQCLWFNTDDIDRAYKDYAKYWGVVKNASERQLGAFYSFYLSKIGELEYDLTTKKASFRNKVTHKGYYCSQEEAYDYLTEAYNYMSKLLRILINDFEEGKNSAISYNINLQLNEFKKKFPNLDVSSSIMAEFHIISLTDINNINNPKPLEERLKIYQESIRLTNNINGI